MLRRAIWPAFFLLYSGYDALHQTESLLYQVGDGADAGDQEATDAPKKKKAHRGNRGRGTRGNKKKKQQASGEMYVLLMLTTLKHGWHWLLPSALG